MDANLLNKTALVTGSSRGIGRDIALGLAAEGADIVVHYIRSREAAEEAAKEIRTLGRRSVAVQADVGSPSAAHRLVQTTVEEFGSIDILINNAATMVRSSFLQLSVEAWNDVLQTNLTGYFLCSQRAARQMVEQGRGGRIIHISSVTQSAVLPNMAPYVTAKGGIYTLSRAMALELACHGISSNIVAPGTIETDINATVLSEPHFREQRLNRVPAGRFGRPADVVGAVVFLASDAADYITGANITVDGGLTVWCDFAPPLPEASG